MKKLLSLLLALVAFPAAAQIPGGGGNIVIGAPVTGCSNSGYVIYNNGGLVGCEAAAGTGITIDSTTITGGTTARLLYDNAGKVGEATITYPAAGTLDGPAIANMFGSNNVGIAAGLSGASILAIGDVAATSTSVLFEFVSQNKMVMISGAVAGWSSTGATTPTLLRAGIDTGFSRIGAGVIAIGNGTAGDFSGTIRATNFTSGSTAGVTCSGVPSVSFASTNGIVTHC